MHNESNVSNKKLTKDPPPETIEKKLVPNMKRPADTEPVKVPATSIPLSAKVTEAFYRQEPFVPLIGKIS